MKVDYFFVGPGKTGTSWLYELFRRRGIASVPSLKEPHIVDLDPQEADTAMRTLYASHERMCDFSNTYSGDPDNPGRIREHNPDAKVIITTRRPSERIVSHYYFHVRSGLPDRGVGPFLAEAENRHVIDRSDYETILARYRAVFPDDQLLVLPMEQLDRDPQGYVDALTDFLGVERITLTDEDHEPVLRRAAPRSRLVARMAVTSAAWLRRLKLPRLLGALKRSDRIKRMLFRDAPDGASSESSPPSFGPATAEIAALDDAYDRFVARETGFVVGR